MPDPKQYTVRDPESGRTVTFAWRGEAPPTDDDIGEVFASLPKEAPLTLERPGPAPKMPGLIETAISTIGRTTGLGGLPGGELGELASRAVQPKNIATTGAVVGGAVGGPVGAAAGGAGGRALQSMAEQVESGNVPTFEDLIGGTGKALKEGATQGAVQAAGAGLAKSGGAVLRPIGRALYSKALAPSKAIVQEFPDVVETGIREGFNVTPKGAAAAERAAIESGQAARATVQASPAAQSGVRLKTGAVLDGLDPLRQSARSLPEANVAQEAIDAFEANVLKSHPKGFTAEELLDFKQAADRTGRAAHKAAQVGNLQAGPAAEMNKAVADRARAVLNENVPGVRDINARTRSLMGVERALDDAMTRPHMLRFLSSIGVGGVGTVANPLAGVPAAAATYAATSPRVLGRAGIMLGRAGQGSGQVPANLLRAALLAALEDEQQPERP